MSIRILKIEINKLIQGINRAISVFPWLRQLFFGPDMAKSTSSTDLYYRNDFKYQIFIRASNVFLVTFFLGIVIVFRTIFIMFTRYNKIGLLNKYIQEVTFSQTGKIFGTLILLFIGFFLFTLKRKRQLMYGILETAFAVVSCYSIIDNVQKLILRNNFNVYVTFPIMTTVYLIVRGLTNVYEGYKKLLQDR